MRQPSTLLLLLFSFFICLASISAQPLAKVEGVQDVRLDKTEAVLSCFGSNIGYCNDENRRINVLTIAKDAEMKGLNFYYLVSGGKIIGRGKNVVWDFTGAKSGKYLIAVGVGKDGIIQGDLVTKTVIASECECHPPCQCPSSIIVTNPKTRNIWK